GLPPSTGTELDGGVGRCSRGGRLGAHLRLRVPFRVRSLLGGTPRPGPLRTGLRGPPLLLGTGGPARTDRTVLRPDGLRPRPARQRRRAERHPPSGAGTPSAVARFQDPTGDVRPGHRPWHPGRVA